MLGRTIYGAGIKLWLTACKARVFTVSALGPKYFFSKSRKYLYKHPELEVKVECVNLGVELRGHTLLNSWWMAF